MTSANFLRLVGWGSILGAAANLLGLITFIMFMTVGDFGPLADVPSLLWVAFTIPVALALQRRNVGAQRHEVVRDLLVLGEHIGPA